MGLSHRQSLFSGRFLLQDTQWPIAQSTRKVIYGAQTCTKHLFGTFPISVLFAVFMYHTKGDPHVS